MRLWICVMASVASFAIGQWTAERSWFNRPPPKAVLRGVKIVPVSEEAEVGGIMIVRPRGGGYAIEDDRLPSNVRFISIHDCYMLSDKEDVLPPFEVRWEREP
jgi:hypothetical protein